MKSTILRAGTLFIALLATSAAGPSASDPPLTPRDVAAASNAFACDLFAQLRTTPGNLFFSPLSISTALAMTYGGARGETATEMITVLHLPGDQASLHSAYAELLRTLSVEGENPPYQLDVANRLWGQRGYGFLESYLETTREYYGAELAILDFRNEAEASRRQINDWVANRTAQKIQDLIPAGAVGELTRLVLTNAIYFHGKWARMFSTEDTRDEPFYTTASDAVKVPMMRQRDIFAYASFPGLELLALPYQENDLSLVVLLPRERDGLPALAEQVTTTNLEVWIDELHERDVSVILPKLKLTSQFQLSRVLKTMGMRTAFDDKADFSGMTGDRDLYITAVIHTAFVDIYEEGTEAAAATGVTMGLTSVSQPPKPLEFRADHPFLFLIRDNRTGTVLFFGRVTEPRS